MRNPTPKSASTPEASDGERAPSAPTPVDGPLDQEAIRRRDIATFFGAALGAVALTRCGGQPEERALKSGSGNEAIGHIAEALNGNNFLWVDTIAGSTPNLRSTVGNATSTPVVVVGGYSTPGDGGGGVFYWNAGTATDDGGTIIVPGGDIGSTGAYWQRLAGPEELNVRWFGAKGDGATDDTVAIQRALDAPSVNPNPSHGGWDGVTVVLPQGQYVVTAPASDCALIIRQSSMRLVGAGSSPNGCRLLVDGTGTAIVIEPAAPPGTGVPHSVQVQNLAIYNGSNAGGMRDGIVVHATNVKLRDVFIGGPTRHGIIIESGTSGSGFIGATRLPYGTGVNADYWRVEDCQVQSCGSGGGGNPLSGSGILAHGSDSNGGLCIGLVGESNNVTSYDATLGGAQWVGCYSEGGQVGYANASTSTSLYLFCQSEDITQASFTLAGAITIGGNITQVGPQGALERVGGGASQLRFKTVGNDGATYAANVPGLFNSAIDFSRTPAPSGGNPGTMSTWRLAWQPSGNVGLPYLDSWRWAHYTNGSGSPDIDVNNGPFGWTDIDNPRGAGLPLIANPLMNTTRRWTLRQQKDIAGRNITLFPGINVIYLNGYYLYTDSSGNPTAYYMADNGGMAFAGDLGNTVWSNVQTRVSVEVEFPDADSLSAADIRLVGYAITPGRNLVAKIVNAGSQVTATLVWHYELFVTNYDPPAGLG